MWSASALVASGRGCMGVTAKGVGATKKMSKAKDPPALSGEDLARLRSSLDSLRALGAGSYPATVKRLFELARVSTSDEALKIFVAPKNAKVFTVTEKSSPKSPDATRNALVYFPEDASTIAESAAIFEEAFEAAKRSGSDIFTSADLKRLVPKALQKAFQGSIDKWARTGKAPFPGVIVLRQKTGKTTKLYLHRLEPQRSATVVQQPGASTRDFAGEFARAFERLDRASGNKNYVLLHDLRRALPDIDRTEFDNRLKELRLAKVFTLDSPDGRHVRLTPEQLDAGIREGSSNLVYVARK
jgi:hypothetical protein